MAYLPLFILRSLFILPIEQQVPTHCFPTPWHHVSAPADVGGQTHGTEQVGLALNPPTLGLESMTLITEAHYRWIHVITCLLVALPFSITVLKANSC